MAKKMSEVSESENSSLRKGFDECMDRHITQVSLQYLKSENKRLSETIDKMSAVMTKEQTDLLSFI